MSLQNCLCRPSAWLALAIVLSMTATCAMATQVTDRACHVRVMTFNIRYNNPGDGQDAWPHRIDMVADILREHADIAGLQEARQEQIEDLESRLPQFQWYGVGRDDGKQGGEFCPIFYRKDRFELLQTRTSWLSETPEVPGSKSWDTAITRLVTFVQFKDRDSGVTFWVLNTHFDHRGSVAREKSGRLVREHFNDLGREYPVVVTGDFNCTPDSKPYNVMTAAAPGLRLIDSFGVSEQPPVGPNSTWNGFQEIVPERRIDFVFVRAGIKVRQHHTLADKVNGRFPSDHLPVVIHVSISND